MSSRPSSTVFIFWNGSAFIVVADRFIADLFHEGIFNLLITPTYQKGTVKFNTQRSLNSFLFIVRCVLCKTRVDFFS